MGLELLDALTKELKELRGGFIGKRGQRVQVGDGEVGVHEVFS
jgi:hypothetical protein